MQDLNERGARLFRNKQIQIYKLKKGNNFFKIDIFFCFPLGYFPLSAIEKLFWNLMWALRTPWIRQDSGGVQRSCRPYPVS